MTNANEKLMKVKKSCGAVRKVAVILTILLIVGCVLTTIGGVVILSMGSRFDQEIEAAKEQGYVTGDSENGLLTVDFIHIEVPDPSSITTDIPAVRTFLDNMTLGLCYSIYLFTISLLLAAFAVVMSIIGTTFKIIQDDDSPFTDKVIKRLTTTMIILSVITGITIGPAFGLLLGFITWALYTILDYGKVLQIQDDETL